jgi:hypothetical protein
MTSRCELSASTRCLVRRVDFFVAKVDSRSECLPIHLSSVLYSSLIPSIVQFVMSFSSPSSRALSSDTPPSSPPSAAPEMETVLSESMLKEEEILLQAREKLNVAREQELEKQRQEDINSGAQTIDKKFKSLDYLLGQSQVR